MKTNLEAAEAELTSLQKEFCIRGYIEGDGFEFWANEYGPSLLADVRELMAAIQFVLDNEMPDAKSQEELGGYVLEDEVRVTLEQALNAANKGEHNDACGA